MRTFLAFPLEQKQAKTLYGSRAVLREQYPRIRWIPPENLHITLAFLGDVGHNQIEELAARMEEEIWNFRSFPITTSGPGQFPAHGHPRVIFENIDKGKEALKSYQSRICNEISDLFTLEKRGFKPHITLARLAGNKRNSGLFIENGNLKPQYLILKRIVLFESILKPSGAEYIPLYEKKCGSE